MRDFYVPKDLLLFGGTMVGRSDFSATGFSAGQAESSATLTVTVSAAVQPSDPLISNVVFLMQGGSLVDVKSHPLTVYGNVYADASGAHFDGNEDYLTSVYSNDFDLSASNFALEAIVNPSAFTTGNMEVIQKDGVSGSTFVQYSLSISPAGKVKFTVGTGTGTSSVKELTGNIVLSTGVDYHIAGSIDGTTMRIFVNGVLDVVSTKNSMSNSTSKPLYIGYQQGQPAATYFRGVIKAARITKGVARYTANFTPPAFPFPTA